MPLKTSLQENLMAAFGMIRSTLTPLPRQNALAPCVRRIVLATVTAPLPLPLLRSTCRITLIRSIGATEVLEIAPAPPPETSCSPNVCSAATAAPVLCAAAGTDGLALAPPMLLPLPLPLPLPLLLLLLEVVPA
jgi:hypothetical protein